jgi:hypothetical protein
MTMTKQAQALALQLAALSDNDKIALAESLLASVQLDDPEWEQAWIAEASRRLDAYDRGDMVAEDAEQVLSALENQYRAP